MYPKKLKKTSISNSTNIKATYSKKEEEIKKKNIIQKMSEGIKNKNHKLFDKLNLGENFIKDKLTNLMENINLTKFDYVTFTNNAEQEILHNLILNNNLNNKINGSENYGFPLNEINNNLLSREKKNKSSVTLGNNISTYADMQNNFVNSNDENNYVNENNDNNNYNMESDTVKDTSRWIQNMVNEKKFKLEELKNYKEKDEWGVLAKMEYMNFLNDKNKHLQKKDERRKEINESLAKQIFEKKQIKQSKSVENNKFNEFLDQNYENWKKSEKTSKEIKEIKYKYFNEQRNNVLKSKLQAKTTEELLSREFESKFLNKLDEEKKRENDLIQMKKNNQKLLLNEQLEDICNKENQKKIEKLKENEEIKKIALEHQQKLIVQERERNYLKNSVNDIFKNQELMENLIVNSKDYDKFITEEVEKRYKKEKEEIDKRTKDLDENKNYRKKLLIDEMIKSNDQQKDHRKEKDFNVRLLDKQFFEQNMIPKINAFKKEIDDKEHARIMKIRKYKEDLDRQIQEKKLHKTPFMDENEKLLNKALISPYYT